MDILRQVLIGLLPSVGMGFLFYKIMKLLLEGDRTERAAYRRWLNAQDAERTPPQSPTDRDAGSADHRP